MPEKVRVILKCWQKKEMHNLAAMHLLIFITFDNVLMILMLIFIEQTIKVELRGTDFVVPSWRAGSQHVVNL